MSNESLSGLKEKAKYCPHCGERLPHEVTSCPNCGKQIIGEVQITGAVKRPTSLTIIAVGWSVGALLFVSQIPSAGFLYVRGLVYLCAAIGLLLGKRWAYELSIIAAVLGIILGTIFAQPAPTDFTFFYGTERVNLLPLLWAAVVWFFVTRPDAKKYLGVTKGISSSERGGMYCPQCGTKNEEESTLCSNCGAPLGVEEKEGAPLGVEEKEGAPPELEREIPEKKRKWKIVAIFFVAVAVFAAVGYYFLGEDLILTDIIFCTSKPSDRSYDEKPDATYINGETAWMYFECYNFQSSKKNNDYVVSFSVKVEIFDSRGFLIGEVKYPAEGSEKVKPSYVWFYFWIDTEGSEEGEYTIRITVTDKLSGKSGTTEGSFFITKE